MSFEIRRIFYGFWYAICAVLFYMSLVSIIKEKFRVAETILGFIIFIVITAVYIWDRHKYYEDIKHRV